MGDLPHISQFFIFLSGLDESSVHSGNTHGAAALHLKQIHKSLVDLAGQYHLSDLHGLMVGDTKAIVEHGFFPHLLHGIVHLRPAAVYQHDFDPHQSQQDDILHDLFLQRLTDHGVSAVFHHNDLAVVFLYIRESVSQYLCPFRIG